MGVAMLMVELGVRAVVTTAAVGALLSATAAPASAWPIPLEPGQVAFLNATRLNVFIGVAEKIPGANRIHYFVVR